MKPNIFEIATKELSQDAFITWLLRWADSSNAAYDENLHRCGVDFATELIRKEFPDFDGQITVSWADRQWERIDVWAIVDHKYLIIIEDKTYTGQHSGQLARYKEISEKWCAEQKPPYEKPVCIYLKTGNESQQSLDSVRENGFKIFSRQDFIALLDRHEIENDIFEDFKAKLIGIEKANNEWQDKIIMNWNGNDWQGFYQFLEKREDIGLERWDYVNSLNGGYYSAMLNWDKYGVYPTFLIIEKEGLCIRVSTNPEDGVIVPDGISQSDIRNEISNHILKAAKDNGLRRPDRFGKGKYMKVAVVDCENWLGNIEEKINKEEVVKKLIYYKKFLLRTIRPED